MLFLPPLRQATFLKRYKRFLADVRMSNGEEATIHCPNTGSMKNCLVENSPCWISESDNPRRKYPFTWELATTVSGHLAGINTARSNALVEEAIKAGVITELQGYEALRREVVFGQEKSRIDFLLTQKDQQCYVEVKNVTLAESNGLGLFPDSVSVRATRHLRELMSVVERGHRAVLLYCVQHTGIDRVAPAQHIDPDYGDTLRLAEAAGVELLAYRAELSAHEIVLRNRLPVTF